MIVRRLISITALLVAVSAFDSPLMGQDSVTVVAGDYSAGWLKRLFFGSYYRDLCTTPIPVPYLDFQSYAGGHTTERTAGYGQTNSLHF